MAMITAVIDGVSGSRSWAAPADCVVNISGTFSTGQTLSIEAVEYARGPSSGYANFCVSGEPIKAGQNIIISGSFRLRIAGFTV